MSEEWTGTSKVGMSMLTFLFLCGIWYAVEVIIQRNPTGSSMYFFIVSNSLGTKRLHMSEFYLQHCTPFVVLFSENI